MLNYLRSVAVTVLLCFTANGDDGLKMDMTIGSIEYKGKYQILADLSGDVVAFCDQDKLYKLELASKPLLSISACPNGKELLLFHEDGTLSIWDLEKQKRVWTDKLAEGANSGEAYLGENQRIAVVIHLTKEKNLDGFITVFDAQTTEQPKKILFPNRSISFSSQIDDRRIFLSYVDKDRRDRLAIADLKQLKLILDVPCECNVLYSAIDIQTKKIDVCLMNDDKKVFQYDLDTLKFELSYEVFGDAPGRIQFAFSGRYLLVCGRLRIMEIIDMKTKKNLGVIEGMYVNCFKVSPNGKQVVVARSKEATSHDNYISTFDVKDLITLAKQP